MRKQFCAYTKGMAGSAALRGRAVEARTAADYGAIARDAALYEPAK
jgi:hypothetical protein